MKCSVLYVIEVEVSHGQVKVNFYNKLYLLLLIEIVILIIIGPAS